MKILPTSRLKKRKLLLLLGGVCLLPVVVIAMLNPTNFAETRPDHSDPQLRTRIYRAAPDEVASAVREIAPQLRTYGRSWRVTPVLSGLRAIGSRDAITVTCEVPVLFFTDDLKVTIREQNKGAQVDVESRSRVGRGDFGENRRHIIQLLHAIDARMDNQLPVSRQQN
jgi:uncharacterized protein (DUF1499 family)